MIAVLATLWLAVATPQPRTIGIEGDVEITLAKPDYQPKPLDDRTPLILRIEQVRPNKNGGFDYDFHFIGFEPGTYRLTDFLMRPDGTAATELGDRTVEIKSVLPPDHNGALAAYAPQPFPWFGGYRMLLGLLGALWVLGLVAFAWFGRRRKVPPPPPPAPPPSYADRLRPFVEAAAAGTLTTTGQAELERLLTGYWRDRLALPDPRMAAQLAALKQHPDAGPLLLALERWLHRPGGSSPEEINRLLEPYRHQPAPAAP